MFSRKTIVIAILAVQVLISRPAKADDSEPTSSRGGDGTPVIFDVRRSLPMEPDEPVYHDFYISAGVEVGIKKGQFLPVARQMPVHDPIQNKQQALLTIAVGKLQVIHVERNMAVARLVSELSDDERPTLEYEAVMIGDMSICVVRRWKRQKMQRRKKLDAREKRRSWMTSPPLRLHRMFRLRLPLLPQPRRRLLKKCQ